MIIRKAPESGGGVRIFLQIICKPKNRKKRNRLFLRLLPPFLSYDPRFRVFIPVLGLPLPDSWNISMYAGMCQAGVIAVLVTDYTGLNAVATDWRDKWRYRLTQIALIMISIICVAIWRNLCNLWLFKNTFTPKGGAAALTLYAVPAWPPAVASPPRQVAASPRQPRR
jgi:hypothetical protein